MNAKDGGVGAALSKAPALSARLTLKVGEGSSTFTARPELALDAGVLVLFGPSGSGKTLTLQAIAGILRPSAGSIQAAGEILFDADRRIDIPAHRRRIGYVPQQSSLFPFASVVENVAFGLPRAERRRSPAIAALLDELGIAHLANARPASLSGGERQRVALARALAVKPKLLLLDEPFASIDREGRAELRRALKLALSRHGTPAVFVTHDEEEAIEMGDSMVILDKGVTSATGAPASLLRRGRSFVVSGVIAGAPSPIEGDEGRVRAELQGAAVEGPAEQLSGGALRIELYQRDDRGSASHNH